MLWQMEGMMKKNRKNLRGLKIIFLKIVNVKKLNDAEKKKFILIILLICQL